jgi:hypothetical protein
MAIEEGETAEGSAFHKTFSMQASVLAFDTLAGILGHFLRTHQLRIKPSEPSATSRDPESVFRKRLCFGCSFEIMT